MFALSVRDVLVCNKLSRVLHILSDNGVDLHDDTYLEKMISGFSKKMSELSHSDPEICNLFWSSCGVESFIDSNLTGKNENFCLKLLSECVEAATKISEKGCQIVELYSGNLKIEHGKSNIFFLIKNLLHPKTCLSSENLGRILNLQVWHTLFLPTVGLHVTSHFMQTVMSDALTVFLEKIFTKFCQKDLAPEIDHLCKAIFLDLSKLNGSVQTDFCSRILSKVLQLCNTSKSGFYLGYEVKVKLILKDLADEHQDIELLTLLLCQEHSKAQDFLLTHFQHTNFSSVDMKKNLGSLKILIETLHEEQIPVQDYWRLICERLIDDNGSWINTSNLTLILDQLSRINSFEFRRLICAKYFDVLKTFLQNSNEECPRDLTLSGAQKLFSTCLTFVELNMTDFVDNFEQKHLWNVLLELSRETDLPVVYRSKVVDVMNQFLSREDLQVDSLIEQQSIFSQIWPLSRTDDWEVLDSFLDLLCTIVRHRLEQIPFEHLLNFAKIKVKDSNSFIRASSTKFIFELLSASPENQHLFGIEEFLENLFLFETEAIVRRTCSKMLTQFEGSRNSPKIRRLMLRALGDLDWEVKEEVLEFWSSLVQNIILEKKLDTFPSFVRILTEFDVILALKISTRDFEERHRNKTFLILRSLKNYVKTNFPSIVLSDLQGLDIDESSLDLYGIVPDTDCLGNKKSALKSSLTNGCEKSFVNDASNSNGHLTASQRDHVIDDILSFAEVSLIKDCLTSEDKIIEKNLPKKVIENLSPLDLSKLPTAEDFLGQILFQIDFDQKLKEFDEFCENQIGLESLLEDIVQASMDASAIDGIDCF